MYVILRDGTVIEHATILGVGPGDDPCLSFYIMGDGYEAEWFDPNRIQTIRFDRDTVNDPPPAPGPDDFKIGTRHDDDRPHQDSTWQYVAERYKAQQQQQ